MKISTTVHPIRRALWRFDSLCSRHQWVPLAGIVLCCIAVMLIESIAP